GVILAKKRRRACLFRPFVITGSGMHVQLRHSPGKLCQLDVNLSPLAVIFRLVWAIGKYILVAQLKPDMASDRRKIIRIVEGVAPTARYFRDLCQQFRTETLFPGREFPVEDA